MPLGQQMAPRWEILHYRSSYKLLFQWWSPWPLSIKHVFWVMLPGMVIYLNSPTHTPVCSPLDSQPLGWRAQKAVGDNHTQSNISSLLGMGLGHWLLRLTILSAPRSAQHPPPLTSVTAWMDAPCFRRSSITLIRFFLQAICRGVKPFWKEQRHISTWLHSTEIQFHCAVKYFC